MAPPQRAAMQPESVIRFKIGAHLAEIAPASERLRRFLSEHRVDAGAIFAMDMVIEEITTNAIKYGFAGHRNGSVTFQASVGETRAELIIEDDGAAFDPTGVADPDVHRPLEEMPIGGLGIHLVRALTDGFEYERVDGHNRVHVWVDRKKPSFFAQNPSGDA